MEDSGALMARMVVTAPDYVINKYNLKALKEVEELVASAVQINIPVRLCSHKIGISQFRRLTLCLV